ncbi:MAG: hypothetical protein EOO45_14835 [Flavobacterium sp.]|nr:MAG: hypothetical protein EOO45_14835 [Flavobacterium sp.]
MKKILIIAIAMLSIGYAFWSCEKDDICPEGTPTTPRLVLKFFNAENQTVVRTVTNLSVKATGMEEPIEWALNTFVVSDTIVRLPLRVDTNTTSYELTINSTGEAPARNTDIITFNYTTNEVYLSRACGYKTQFLLDPNVPVTAPNPLLDAGLDGAWVRQISVQQTNIEDENERHINIFF